MKSRSSITTLSILIFCAITLPTLSVWAHCEMPCGIYHDQMRVDMLKEDIQTIEKSMTQIKALSTENPQEANQLVRWVTTKEDHANKIQEVVYQYFMNQRIKPVEKSDGDAYEAYVTQLTLLHKMLTESMKCKQTVDPVHVENLKSLVANFEKAYFTEVEHDHK